VRQRRLKAFGMRADYLAQAMDDFGGSTITPFDIYNLNGRLFVLGNRQTLLANAQAPTDLFELISPAGETSGTWKGTLPPDGTGTRVPCITALRNIGQAPDATAQVQAARVAAVNGFVCLAYGFGTASGGATSHVHIFRADTDSTILRESVAISNARVVVAGDSFWIIGVNSANDLLGYRFDVTGDFELQSPVTLYTGTVTSSIFDACSVSNTSITQFAVFLRDGSTTVIRRFNEAGTQQTSFAGPAVAPDVMVIEADAQENEILVATRVGSADVNLSTYNLTTNALVAGPTAMFGEAVSGSLSIVRGLLSGSVADLITEDATDRVLRSRFITANHLGNTVTATHNYRLGGQGVRSTLGVIQPVISGDQSNQLLVFDLDNDAVIYVGAQNDDQIANPLIGAVGKGGQCCFDATTSRHYWARILEGTDGQAIAGVSEFIVASTARRQLCQVGNAALLAGAVPSSFDLRQVVESGFLERPTFVSIASSATGGDLIPGATYDYVAIFQWIDGQNRITRSRLSDVQQVTLGATHNGVTAVIYAPHTMRKDSVSGSVPVISLYRVDATEITTNAEVTGTETVTPPSSSLNGQSLQLFVTDSSGGPDPFVVTFGPTDDDADTIAATINAVTTGRLTATNVGEHIKLTVDDPGEGSLLQIFGTTGGLILGIPANTTSSGTSTFVRGTVFHLAASAVVPVTDAFGQSVTLVDNTSDEDLLEAETLYTNAEQGALSGILQREAPPPFRFCAAVGARAFLGGLPDPSEVAISFELSPGETLAFSSEPGFRAFVDGDVTAVGSLDGQPVAFTADAIYRFPFSFPDDQGKDGELGPPVRIPSEGGCGNEFSLLETSIGLFYQARDTKLMILPRGGTAPVWIGQLVQDSLADFPNIVGTAYVDEDHCALFCCQNAAGTASIILVYDLKIGQWYRDEFASAQVIKASVDYLGRLAYIDTATVRLQSSSLTPSTFIPYNAMSGSLAPFYSHGGHGSFIQTTINGEFRGNATLQCRISYDDGVTFTTLATKTFATPTFAVGQSFTVQWYPRVRKGSTFVLDFPVTALAGAATAGLILNSYTIEVIDAQPIARQRTTSSQRG
jgi:hypothetical protein